MKTIINISIACLFLLFSQVLFSQENSENPTFDDQFNSLLEESGTYKDYKVIKIYKLAELQENTNAKISKLEQKIDTANKTIETQKGEISDLKSTLSKVKNDLGEVTRAKEEMTLLGVRTSKAAFRGVMWGIVVILILLLLFFIYRFKNSHTQTREAKRNLQKTENEYEEYRKRALEKQQKMGRELQDERNKATKVSKK